MYYLMLKVGMAHHYSTHIHVHIATHAYILLKYTNHCYSHITSLPHMYTVTTQDTMQSRPAALCRSVNCANEYRINITGACCRLSPSQSQVDHVCYILYVADSKSRVRMSLGQKVGVGWSKQTQLEQWCSL